LIAKPFFLYLTQVEQKESRQEESVSANLPHPFHLHDCSEFRTFFNFGWLGENPRLLQDDMGGTL
jgi:hypothetical protein